MTNKRILVPLDGSKEAECILPLIKPMVSGFVPPARVILYSAIEAISSPMAEFLFMDTDYWQRKKKYENEILPYLKGIEKRLRDDGIEVEQAVAMALAGDNVAEGILSFVEKNVIDLIIMSTHARSHKVRRPFGSVTHAVLERSGVPVLVVPTPGFRKKKR